MQSYVSFKRLRSSFAQRLFLFLTIADLAMSVGYTMSHFLPIDESTGYPKDGPLCSVQV